MLPNVSALTSVAQVQPLQPPSTQTADSPFSDVLGSAIQEIEGARASADQTIDKFLSGDGGDLHSTILASQRADLEFQMFLQVRNKVVSAYQEVMKMQL